MQKEINALQTLINKVVEFFVNYSFQLIGALIILVIGIIIAKWVTKIVLKLCDKKNLDKTLSSFLASLTKLIIVSFVILIALGKFGITITPLVAALGAVIFGATYAIQGPLSNYGAGLSIIFGRPFIIGDAINISGESGVVEEVKLANTTLIDEDGVKITIPNKQIVGEIVRNSGDNRIVEASIGISYSDDPEKAISAVKATLENFEEIIKKPEPQIGIENFGDSSINIAFRYWVPAKKYFKLSYQVNLEIFKALNKANISIPFPQREVLIKKESHNKSISD